MAVFRIPTWQILLVLLHCTETKDWVIQRTIPLNTLKYRHLNGGQLKGLKRFLTIKLSAAMNFKWYDHRDYV